MQLEDGSTAYIQHTVHMPQSNTILAIQADGTIADLQAEAAALDPETISVLEQYTTKVNARLHLCGRVRRLANTSCDTNLCCRFLDFLLLNMFRPFSVVRQVENIENPLGSYSRVEADSGVHMRVNFSLHGVLRRLC